MKYTHYMYLFSVIILFDNIIAQSLQDMQRLRLEYEKMKKSQEQLNSESSVLNQINDESGYKYPSEISISPYKMNDLNGDTSNHCY